MKTYRVLTHHKLDRASCYRIESPNYGYELAACVSIWILPYPSNLELLGWQVLLPHSDVHKPRSKFQRRINRVLFCLIAGIKGVMHIKVAPKQSTTRFRQKSFSSKLSYRSCCRSYFLQETFCPCSLHLVNEQGLYTRWHEDRWAGECFVWIHSIWESLRGRHFGQENYVESGR